jgi:hypothetical protein
MQLITLKEKSLWRPIHSRKDNIKMDFEEVMYEDVDWIHLAQDRFQWLAVVKTVMHL